MTDSEKTGPTISVKVPDALKALYDNLTPEQKKHCKQEIIEVIERNIHSSRFRKGMYSASGLGDD